jgi:metal-responsive CopG/Arc/MetJ family transcriptional regulator
MSTSAKRKTKRTGKAASFVGLWIPDETLNAIDRKVTLTDSDRSKFIRDAIKRKLQQPA